MEVDGKLPFSDLLITRKPDGTLGRTVFHKATHTNPYLSNSSSHHPAQGLSSLATLIDRAKKLTDTHHLEEESQTLKHVFVPHGYSLGEMNRMFKKTSGTRIRQQESEEEIHRFASYFMPQSVVVSPHKCIISLKFSIRKMEAQIL